MCDRTYSSNPAHPQFCNNCLSIDEQIEKPKNCFWESQKTQKNPKNQVFSKKWCMNKNIASKETNSLE